MAHISTTIRHRQALAIFLDQNSGALDEDVHGAFFRYVDGVALSNVAPIRIECVIPRDTARSIVHPTADATTDGTASQRQGG